MKCLYLLGFGTISDFPNGIRKQAYEWDSRSSRQWEFLRINRGGAPRNGSLGTKIGIIRYPCNNYPTASTPILALSSPRIVMQYETHSHCSFLSSVAYSVPRADTSVKRREKPRTAHLWLITSDELRWHFSRYPETRHAHCGISLEKNLIDKLYLYLLWYMNSDTRFLLMI